MKRFRFGSIVLGFVSFLLCSVCSIAYALPVPRLGLSPPSPYNGRIIVRNTSTSLIEVSLLGDHCRVSAANHRVIRECQSTYLAAGQQFTFFLNYENVKSSSYLWLELKYPNAMIPTQAWYCHDRQSRMRVDGADERLATYGVTNVEIRDTWVDSTRSVSCILGFDPNAL